MQGATQSDDGLPAGGSVLWRHLVAAAARRGRGGAAPPGPSQPQGAPPRSPERAVAGAIGRAADRVYRLPLFFDRIEWSRAALVELGELLPEGALVSMIEGPDDSLGVFALCPELMAAVTEMQTAGRVSSRPAPPRRPTRTDGSICTDFINATLAELGAEPGISPGRDRFCGYRYASHMDDLRTLDLLLEDGEFHLLSVSLRAGEAGQRRGRMVIAWPSDPAQTGCDGGDPPAQHGGTDAPSLAEAVHSAPIELLGVLCRRRISLRELATLSPGDVIALPPDVLAHATLETAIGQVLFRGKLGEMAGRHALRLLPSPDAPPETLRATAGPPPLLQPDSLPLGNLDTPDPFRPVSPDIAAPMGATPPPAESA